MDKEFLKTMIFMIITIGLLLLALFSPIGDYFTKDSIINYIHPLVEHNKIKAILIFFIAMTLLPMLWVPRLIMTAVAGVVFGIKEGFVYALIGSTTAGVIGYYFAKMCTSTYFEKKIQGKKWVKYLDFSKSNAFWLILLARICPVTHYEIINYVCGTSNVKFKTFFWSTFWGIIPGTLVYVWMGDVILNHGWFSTENMNVMIILAIFLIVTSYGFYKIVFKEDNEDDNILINKKIEVTNV